MAWTRLVTQVSVNTYNSDSHWINRKHKTFTDPYALDAALIREQGSRWAMLHFALDMAMSAHVEPSPHQSLEREVVLSANRQSRRFPLAAQVTPQHLNALVNERNGSVQGIGLYFDVAAKYQLPAKPCITLQPGEPLIASIICQLDRLGPNDSVAELVYEAELCLRSRLLRHFDPKLSTDTLLSLLERPP